MAKGESRLLSGRIKTKSGNTLDSKRSTFLSLDNAEPNFGNPDSDRYILASLTNGGRLFLKLNKGFLVSADSVSGDESTFEIDPSGLSNAAGTTLADVLDNLDSAITGATDLALTLALTNPTITDSNFNGSGIVSDPLTLDSDLRIFGITGDSATFTNITSAGTVDFSGATIIDGGTVTTVDIDGGTIDGTTIGHTTPDSASFTTISTSGAATLASASVTDLTDNRVVIAGTAGELEDDVNLTYDGTSLNVANTTESTNSANGALVVTGGVGIGGALNVGGNVEVNGDFTVTGTTTTVDVETLSITDPLIHLADSNESSDEVDIGFIGHYYDVALGGRQHTGLFRDASNDEYYIFAQYQDSALDSSPRSNVIDRTRSSFVLAPFNAMSVTAETLSGTVSADSITTTNLTAASVDINGGTIDSADITLGVGNTLNVTAGTLTLADNQISGDKIEGGTIGNVTVTNLTSGNVNIDGGFIDGTAIGHTTPDSGTFTNLARTSPAGVTAGTYGSKTTVPIVNVDASGFINGITTDTLTFSLGGNEITLGDDVDNLTIDSATITKLNVTGTATLASVDINGGTIDGTTIGHTTPDSATFTNLTRTSPSGVTAGAYGSVTEIPVVTVDASGFVDSIGKVTISTTMNTAADTGTGSVNLLDSSLAIVGGVGIDTTASGRTITISAATSGVVAGTYGSNTEIPVITVDSYGQVDSVGLSSVSFGLADADIDALEFDSATGSLSISTGVATFTTVITLDPYTTDDLVEGDSNKYYTKIRVDSDIREELSDINQNVGITGDLTVSGTINDLDIGHGGGNVATNTIVGRLALADNTSGLENTAVGRSALENNTIGIRNTAIGYRSLRTNDSGDFNIAIGYSSMLNAEGSNNIGVGIQALNASTGVDNVALGTSALKSANPGSYNTAIGNQAMTSATDGSFNVAIGRTVLRVNTGNNNVGLGEDALRANTSGGNNIAIGLDAVRTTTIGHDNIGIGRTALNLLNSGDDNVAIGGDAGDNLTTGSVNTLIGYGSQASTATVSNEITLGDGTDKSFRIPGSQFYINGGSVGTVGSNVGIGTSTPTEQLDVNGNAVISGTINTLQVNNGNGDDAFSTAVGLDALVNVNSGTLRNTAVGRDALEDNTSGERNTAVGQGAMANATTGSYNTAIGQGVMGTGIVTSNFNTGIGISALNKLTSGPFNTAIGSQSPLGNTTTGQSNTAIGPYTLIKNEEGSYNVAIGRSALAGSSLGDYTGNTVIGTNALDGLNPGQNNHTVIGYRAGRDLDSGTENIIIGSNAEASATAVSNEITLGDTGSKSFRIPGSEFYINGGSEGTVGSNVGIGTSTPTSKLHVNGDLTISDLVKFEGDSATVASAATAVIATAATSSFNAIEATIVSENATNGNRQISKVLLTHDTTDTYMNEYSVITSTDSDQFTMDADISGSDFRLKLENVSGNTLYAKTSITYL